MDLEQKRKEVEKVIEYLLHEYNQKCDDCKKKIVFAAPAHGDDGLIRMYMNGGDIGKISIKAQKKTTGIDYEDYSHRYKGPIPEVVHIFDKGSKDERDRLNAFKNKEYLEYVQLATATYSEKSASCQDKERTIESLIMGYENQKTGNAAVDMEMQYSVRQLGWVKEKEKQAGHEYPSEMTYRKHKWYNEEDFSDVNLEKMTKSPRVDLMVLNDNGIGFVELKYENKNCKNLSSHISHMNYILKHPGKFIEDAERRLSVLDDYGLLAPEMKPNYIKWKKTHQIWCGIMFVGEAEKKLDEAKNLIKKVSNIQNIKCCFVDTNVVNGGRLNMDSYFFVSSDTFISPDYQGNNN